MTSGRPRARRALGLSLMLLAPASSAQMTHSSQDPNGMSIPYAFRHLVHSRDTTHAGTTAHLRAHDPFLLYQLGRDLVQRQFHTREGAVARAGELSVGMYVAEPGLGVARFARDHASGCGLCHSIPAHEPGAGQTIASTGGAGRNTPHFYGAGLVEMLAEQSRRLVLERYDANRNGFIDRQEVARPSPLRLAPVLGAALVDYGDLSPGPDGVPRLNSVLRVWYVDAAGRSLPHAASLRDPGVAGFDFAFQFFGWGRGYHRDRAGRRVSEGAEAATLRGIFAAAAELHMGLQAHDPSQQRGTTSNDGPGRAGVSLNGALQFDFDAAPDRGRPVCPEWRSSADPDGDGHASELTEGDLDAAEFYMLHAPVPALRPGAASAGGRDVALRIGCLRCHVEDWQLEARDDSRGLTGDRRLFRFEPSVEHDVQGNAYVLGRLVRSARLSPPRGWEPAGEAFRVRGVYSDFKHWDVGPAFHERRFDGSLQREHRTAPLWGVGSTAPYGHAGQFLTLQAVVEAHAGAAEAESRAFRRLRPAERDSLIAYLESLVLYASDRVPADVDGDGRIDAAWRVDGQPVGYERFEARFLFAVPPRFETLYTAPDVYVDDLPLMLLTNVAEAYGLEQPYRRDADGDASPDWAGLEACPQETP